MIRRSHSTTQLSLRQANFAKEYIKTRGNTTQAYKNAYGTEDDNVAASAGFRLLRMDKVKNEIERINREFDEKSVTPKIVIGAIADLALDVSKPDTTRTENLKSLAKIGGMFLERVETVTKPHDNLAEVSTDDLQAELVQRLRIGQAGVFSEKITESKQENIQK
jgi:hypothetical protein